MWHKESGLSFKVRIGKLMGWIAFEEVYRVRATSGARAMFYTKINYSWSSFSGEKNLQHLYKTPSILNVDVVVCVCWVPR